MSLSTRQAPTLRKLVDQAIQKLEARERVLKGRLEMESPVVEWIDLRKEAASIIEANRGNHAAMSKLLAPLASRERVLKKRMEDYNRAQKVMSETIEELVSVQGELGNLRSEAYFMDKVRS